MGEQLRIDDDDNDGVAEWEAGLPSVDQLASLSLSLIPADLASAFRILPEPLRTVGDVNRASHSTLTSLRDIKPASGCQVYEQEGSDPKKSRLMGPIDEEAGGDCMEEQSMDVSEKAVKKSRLVWTPQLHKRFVEVVGHLGLKNAMPKTIMQLMNVEGLTRENVASHLQKYRLYIKRMQGWSNEGPSPSDHLFDPNEATSNGGGPIHGTGNGNENRLHNSDESGNHEACNGRIPMQMPYPLPLHFTPVPAENVNSGYHGIQQHHNAMMMMQQPHNNMMMQQQRDWPEDFYFKILDSISSKLKPLVSGTYTVTNTTASTAIAPNTRNRFPAPSNSFRGEKAKLTIAFEPKFVSTARLIPFPLVRSGNISDTISQLIGPNDI